MKAEVNKENKRKFFAQYWGQKCFLWDYPKHCTIENYKSEVDGLIETYVDCGCLVLKHLSEITDKDAINVGLIHIDELHAVKVEWVRDYLEDFELRNDIRFEEVDYLRSRGYSLPWMGLSVDEIVEAGWIKLK